ncbi:MAG: redox-sensing transcriptional repressor Rex [Pseudomonadota bacterium]
MSNKKKIAEVAIARLSIYNRALGELEREGVEIISSDELGDRIGCSAAQIRKDLSCFGEFGETGKGYYVRDLKDAISRILGVDRKWNVALVGAGHLGSALLTYPGFREHGFNIVAVFDNDLRKIGKKWEDIVIQDISELPKTVKERDIRIGIITVPAGVSQEIANMLTSCGVRAILNFAPARITIPEGVELRNADLSTELECLSYFLTNEAEVRTEVFKKIQNSSGGG